jgi:hypothetical protein
MFLSWGTNSATLDSSSNLGVCAVNVLLTNVLSGLSPATTYYYSYSASNAAGWGYSQTSNFTTYAATPAIANVPVVSNLLMTSATVYGYLSSTGESATAVFLSWGTTAGVWTWTNSFGTCGIGTVSTNLTGLAGATTYHYQFAASNAAGWGYSPTTNSFMTLTGVRLTNHCDLSLGGNLTGSNLYGSGAVSIANTGGNGATNTPWLYAVPGVDCAGYRLATTNGDSFALNLQGSNLVGNSGVTNLSTFRSGNEIALMGSVTITNVGSIACGKIDLHNGNTAWKSQVGDYKAGSLRVGDPLGSGSGPATGSLRIDGIDTYVPDGRAAGSVTIYGLGDVLIQSSNGVLSAIDTHVVVAEGTAPAGPVTVLHRGAFAARGIDTYGGPCSTWPSGGNVTLLGNYGGVSPSGACTVPQIQTYVGFYANYGGVAGSIAIAGYTSVTVSNLWSYNDTGAGKTPGNIAITNVAGSITINGSINANSLFGTADGTLTLQTTAGSGGDITVQALNLTNVQYAAFNPDGSGFILGPITGTNGAAATAATVTNNLRVPAGKWVWYWPDLNPGLSNRSYTVANLSGGVGGGTLRPVQPKGSLFLVR